MQTSNDGGSDGQDPRLRRFSARIGYLSVTIPLLMTVSLASCTKRTGEASITSAQVADPVPGAVVQGQGQPLTGNVNSLDWLVRNSRFVFVGRLLAKDVETDSRHLVITRNHFDVTKALIGTAPPKMVTLTTFGGTIGDETVSVSDTPEFVEGRTYIIFTDLARTTYNPITGDTSGVFPVVNSNVYTYDGPAVAAVQDGKIRLSPVTLEPSRAAASRQPGPSPVANPTVAGGVLSAQRTVVKRVRPMQLAEFSRLILAIHDSDQGAIP